MQDAEQIQEGDAKEITLHDDNPEALEVLLAFGYDDIDNHGAELFQQMLPNDTDQSAFKNRVSEALFCASVAEVADKYEAPKLSQCAADHFSVALSKGVQDLIPSGAPSGWGEYEQPKEVLDERKVRDEFIEGLLELVETIYSTTTGDNSIRKELLQQAVIMSGLKKSYNEAKKIMRPALVEVTANHPEFGQDVLRCMLTGTCEYCGRHFMDSQHSLGWGCSFDRTDRI